MNKQINKWKALQTIKYVSILNMTFNLILIFTDKFGYN